MASKLNGGGGAQQRLTWLGLLISLGIVYGDIGTSPLYTIKAIVGDDVLDETLLLGGFSCIFWTLTFQTTLKYVLITLQADNHGEGGIFSLYTLIRRTRRFLFIPAILGGCFLLADGIITPPITVSSAIEGLNALPTTAGGHWHVPTLPLVLGILTLLFLFQQFGTKNIGSIFGWVMLVWFGMLAYWGATALAQSPQVLRALNPAYAYRLLVNHPNGYWLLGAVFLCTTGAEALYSDLGHCGRANIRISWIFVKTSLLLNYAGQVAYLMGHVGQKLDGTSPFYLIMSPEFLPYGISIATAASIVASQALISGSFTLINEAIRLDFWPRMRVVYPTDVKGQLYIPAINWLLYVGCVGIVLYFRESKNMEAAYGLAVTVTMLMTSLLLLFYLLRRRVNVVLVVLLMLVFFTIETAFLVANLLKLEHGGWVTVLIGSALITVMFIWHRGREIKNRFQEVVPVQDYLPMLQALSQDATVPKYATHLVYLTWSRSLEAMDRRILYSILNRQPKRADIYWFLNIEVVDTPYHLSYRTRRLYDDNVIYLQFRLGFRNEPRVSILFRRAIESMVKNEEVDIISRYPSLRSFGIAGDFRFVLLDSFLSYENELKLGERLIMRSYFQLARLAVSDARNFGLDTSSTTNEKVPLIISLPKRIDISREDWESS